MKSVQQHLSEIDSEFCHKDNSTIASEYAQCRYDLAKANATISEDADIINMFREELTNLYHQLGKHSKSCIDLINFASAKVLPISGPTNIPGTPQYVKLIEHMSFEEINNRLYKLYHLVEDAQNPNEYFEEIRALGARKAELIKGEEPDET